MSEPFARLDGPPASTPDAARTSTRLAPGVHVHTFGSRDVSHLLVAGDHAVLIDCHDRYLPERIRVAGLPLPQAILHTHIQPQHCREGTRFGTIPIFVHAPDAVLAFEPDVVSRAVRNQRADMHRWASEFGQEPFGVAGCQMEFPPIERMHNARLFREGDRIPCGALSLEVLPLPFHGRHGVGFCVRNSQGRPLGVFCGDFFCDGPYLVDAFSLVADYASSRLATFAPLAARVQLFGHLPFFPSTGAAIFDASRQMDILSERIFALTNATPPDSECPIDCGVGLRRVGRFREIERGVFNMTTAGNTIVLIPDDGRGLMIDPGPCDYDNSDRYRDFLEDLRLLEREAGLRQVDLVLVTHFHGDHIDATPLIRDRYPACRVATWSCVADVMEFPNRFPYACQLPWYDLGFDNVRVDDRLEIGDQLAWRNGLITLMHLPGHALRHCGFLIHFNERLLAITGDTVQGRGEADTGQIIIPNHASPMEGEGPRSAYLELARHSADVNLGGHGSYFWKCADVYRRSLDQIDMHYAALSVLFSAGSLREAFVPPWFRI